MITGSAKVRMDDKGRLAIPNRFREPLAKGRGLVLTLHPHNHLILYSEDVFEARKQQLLAMPNIGYMESHLLEVFIGCAEQVAMDGTGRVMVQNHLRERAKIEREVLLFGVGDNIHIWDEKSWEQRNEVFVARLQDEGFSERWQNIKL